MHYKDIPKLTQEGNYAVNIPLHDLLLNIDRYITQYDLQLNPDFQRGNVWTELQQIAYIEYLLRGGTAARTFYFNHAGWMNTFVGDFVLVDGLQRITAIMRFLKNEIKVFGCYHDGIDGLPRTSLDVVFNINNLKTRKEVLQWYIDFNTGGTVHTDEEITKVRELLIQEG